MFTISWSEHTTRNLGLAIACLSILTASQQAAKSQISDRETSPNPAVAALMQLRTDDLEGALQRLGDLADENGKLEQNDADSIASAAGGLHRALSQRSTDEQYDLLHQWSLPTESRKSVRILSSSVPQNAPPKEFARLLGERPRDTSFPISEIGGIRGLFSTAWTLSQAAADTGRLRRLIGELEPLAEQNVPNADVMLLIARLADRRGETESLAADLRQQVMEAQQQVPGTQPSASIIDPSEIILVAAALEHEELQPVAEELLNELLTSTQGISVPQSQPLLRLAHATAMQRHRGESSPNVLRTNRLKYWVPVSGRTSRSHANGDIEATWLVHEDHILHLAGSGNDVLFFRYPLTGDFTFSGETQEGGPMGTDGGLVYGGLQFEALGRTNRLTVSDADIAHPVQKPCPFVRHEEQPTFNRVAIRSGDKGAQFLSNGHPVWFDSDAVRTSPWLGLRSLGSHRPVFRNLKLSGTPTIPRKVPLTAGNELRGWRSQFLGESQPAFAGAALDNPVNPVTADAADFDWSINEGILQAARQDAVPGRTSQSLLSYQRPLQDGESVTYEFHHLAEEFAAHPALGRLAFLIEPTGVRIHWITDGEREWTGLTEDNVAIEPLNRRGPGTLPLNENDWNSVSLTRESGKVTIILNGERIYERPIDYGGDHTFGLYRDRTQSAARVQNIVMTGDWPDTVPEEFLQNPATVTATMSAPADRHVLNRVLGEEIVAENVRIVRRQAAGLSPTERFEFLCDWVLPGQNHTDFRMAGEFTATDPSPLAVQLEGVDAEPFSKVNPTQRGANLVSPVFDLLDLAASTDRLDELHSRIDKTDVPSEELPQRARTALLALVHLEQNKTEAAGERIGELHSLVAINTPVSVHDQWPETLVAYRGIHQGAEIGVVGDLVMTLYDQRARRSLPAGLGSWHMQIYSLAGKYRQRQQEASNPRHGEADGVDDWIPVVREWSRSRGLGNAYASWSRTADDEMAHWAGRQEEYLFYRSPLRGDFELECDLAPGSIQVLTAGLFCGPKYTRDELVMGDFRRGEFVTHPVDPPFEKYDQWVHYRAVFRKGVCRIFVMGRPVYEMPLADDYDPWIGFRTWWRNDTQFRDVQITGNPEIPEVVVMSALPDFSGWLPYYSESVGTEDAAWQFVSDSQNGHQIVASRRPEMRGTYLESLLRYHRPLIEDGSIDYEFFYEPNQTITHPALDRLTFLLDPSGVQEHWITDGPFDRSQVAPDNTSREPENRRGPKELPLKPNAWNRLQLAIEGNTVTLTLNDEAIYQRDLEATNHRTFGLFRYADHEVRVRNVTMRGEWPKSLPSPSEQELRDRLVATLNADVSSLPAVFTHDFAKDGISEQYVKQHDSNDRGPFVTRDEGVFVFRPMNGEWAASELRLPFMLHGDFEVEASFEQLKLETDFYSCIMLDVHMDDADLHQCRLLYQLNKDQRRLLQASRSVINPDGSRSYATDSSTTSEAVSGKLRIGRRGDTIHYLFAENDSEVFQVIGRHVISDQPTVMDGLRLRAMGSGTGNVQVLWKDLSLRADRITYVSPNAIDERVMYVMKTDGSESRLLTTVPQGLTHMGSPEWSPDGKQIAFDASAGSVSTSHIFVINADGNELRDVGPGCMPSFSTDSEQIVFSHSGQGIMMMDADGSNRRTIDSSGWGVQWSPDGKQIAYAKSGNITLRDVTTGQSRELIQGKAADQYNYISWNLGWSHDSRSIAFKGRNRQSGEYEVAAVDLDTPDRLNVVYDGPRTPNADFTWTADGQHVLFAMQDPDSRSTRIFAGQKNGDTPPTILPHQPDSHRILDGDVSPEGTAIVYSAITKPMPIEWSPAATR